MVLHVQQPGSYPGSSDFACVLMLSAYTALPADAACCSPLSSPDTVLAIIFMAVYACDIILNFFVAFYREGELVTEHRLIAGVQCDLGLQKDKVWKAEGGSGFPHCHLHIAQYTIACKR